MAKGSSGRIVIEVDPELKNELYEALNLEKSTLKEWFLLNAKQFLENKSQLNLALLEDENARRAK